MSDHRTHWERVAATRWGSYIAEIERRAVLLGHEVRGTPTTALEVGCEGGRWAHLLTELGWHVTCTEVDDALLRLCKARIPSATCVLVSPNDQRLPCDSASTDLLLCIEVGPVIQAPWFPGEAARVTREGGVIVGVFWNLLSIRGLLAHVRARIRGRTDHYQLAYPAWRRRLLRAGYRVLHEEGFCWFPFHRASESAWVPQFTRLEARLGLRRLWPVSPWVAFVAQKQRPAAAA